MNAAILLAAGSGRRMGTPVPKQFLEVGGEPLIARSLRVFEESSLIDVIYLVCPADYLDYCRKEIVAAFGFSKVKKVLAGGRERYDSVYAALCALERDAGDKEPQADDYVFIHDGARPFVTEEILRRTYEGALETGACTAGMPSKDSIKLVDGEGMVEQSIPRSRIWNIQTPQVFSVPLILSAHRRFAGEREMTPLSSEITDDAVLVERYGLARVKMAEGSYQNRKITTPEDLSVWIPSDLAHPIESCYNI